MIWSEYGVFFFSALIISYLVAKNLPALFERFSIYDQKSLPEKKITAGGISIVIAFLAVVLLTALFGASALNLPASRLFGLSLSLIIIALLGFVDDWKGVTPFVKLLLQLLAVIILLLSGFTLGDVTNPIEGSVELGFLGTIILIVWILAITNGVNLIDGIDGLATGICLISSITLFTISHIFGEYTLSLFAVIIAGAMFGFVTFNLPPAKIYLGDTGSLFLGFLLAAISLTEKRKGSATVTLLIPLVILAVPLIDTSLAFFRRSLKGENPLKGDLLHIHHRLSKLGLKTEQINRMLYLFTIYLGFTATALSFFPKELAMIILFLLAVGLFMGFYFLHSLEQGMDD